MSDGSLTLGLRRPMRSLEIASSGLSAQKARMDVIANNIANAETTRTADGGPYRRQTLVVEEAGFQPVLERSISIKVPRVEAPRVGEQLEAVQEIPTQWRTRAGGVRVAGVAEDQSEGQLVYDPGHPDANDEGYVRMPNVSITEEMVSMMDARRLFEANASVFEAIKSMLRQAARL